MTRRADAEDAENARLLKGTIRDLITPERALGDILAMREYTALSVVASGAHEYACHGNPHVAVTVAWGTRDVILLHRQAARAQCRLPGARHIDLRACGHVP